MIFLMGWNRVWAGLSLFADDGSLWKRGCYVKYVVGKVQEAIGCVERWACRFLSAKTKAVFFGKKRVESFKFLGLLFDARLTWRVHIEAVVQEGVECGEVSGGIGLGGRQKVVADDLCGAD